MQTWRSTKRPGVYVAHQTNCPANSDPPARCRCKPSYRGRRRHPVTAKPIWQKATKDRAEVLTWLADAQLAAELAETEPHPRASLEVLGDEWLDGVESGVIGRRRGKGKPYSETTIVNYRRSWQHVLRPEFGPIVAEEITEIEWQMWVDRLSQEGLSRSRIANHVASPRAIYGWALAADQAAGAEQPDEGDRAAAERREAAHARRARAEARAAARRARARLPDPVRARVLRRATARGDLPAAVGGRRARRLPPVVAAQSKSAAGTNRRPPIAEPLREILRAAALRQAGRRRDQCSSARSCPASTPLTRRRPGSGRA